MVSYGCFCMMMFLYDDDDVCMYVASFILFH